MAMSEADDKAARKAKKAEMKEEAQALGISYEELKARKKKDGKKREATSLSTDEHSQDMKRMRKWSKDLTTEENVKRRTRSMDQAEEKKIESSMSPDAWRAEHSITLKGHGASANQETPAPFFQFTDAPFSQTILQTIKQAGFTTPSHIQAQAWPIAVTGKDMICIAKTGSGKTCGFLLPSFHQHLQRRHNASVDQLAFALYVVLEDPKYPQIAALQRGVECVIATPGRLNDLLEMKKANLNSIKYVVLDEADRMLDMGFEPQIRTILTHVTQPHQTLLFSATWPKEIQRLAFEFLKDPIQINVGEVNVLVANKDITQVITVCEEHQKFDKLKEILNSLIAEGEAEEASQVARKLPTRTERTMPRL
ncbi:helicase [Fragilaria crotonensis]|nr:helicase [Fragilaria crotonensis]